MPRLEQQVATSSIKSGGFLFIAALEDLSWLIVLDLRPDKVRIKIVPMRTTISIQSFALAAIDLSLGPAKYCLGRVY